MNLDQILDVLKKYQRLDYDLARSMPPAFYTSEEIFALEQERLFRSQWICLGRVDQIPNPGDYFTTILSDEPLIVVRSNSNEIKILSNVCRHRGSVIADDSGNCKVFVCPYHSWTYNLDGVLRHAPLIDKRSDFDPNHCRLPSFASEVWSGFIYVNLDGTSPSLVGQLEGLSKIIKHYHMDEMTEQYAEESIWDCNWKSLTENFMEGYHLSTVHRDTLHRITPTRLSKHFPPGQDYFGFYSVFPDNLPQRGKYHADLTAEERTRSVMFAVPPLHVAGVAGHKMSYLYLRPETVNTVRVKRGIALLDSEISDSDLKNVVDLFERTMEEDSAQLSRVSRGLKSQFLDTAPLGAVNYEGNVCDFYHYLARKLL